MVKNDYYIKFTESAFNDLDEIYFYITHETSNENIADNILEEIEKSIYRLKEFPQIGNLINNNVFKKRGYRKLVIGNYIIIYKINQSLKSIYILRILYSSRNYISLL
ncbi:MAG: type II toxin-antitoxin system RelE/ParE family toxin [Candidatus Muirbacterium halophilum]|nr:type II toxin-antitoxin system RelE/ParE family toxin [Candidatus Muirbacterium halophilum]MCK9475877.1 type II toxin-antitoxin system RelE/ParE family toxin [Candidatus Muirbacterium halophilum]